ncbi:MAG TPA: response regulator [Gemmatimonadales bacterium]
MPERRSARILLVEDDARLRSALGRWLEQAGDLVHLADDGLDGWHKVEAASPPYDLVITDSRMPRMPGRVLVAMIRERYPTMRIIRIGGDPAELDERLEGIVTLAKPFSLEELDHAIAEALR